jgi:divalent metal cation (Fe/Co/Zn/Cd) transporter
MIGLIILSIGIFIVCANSQLFYDKVFRETQNEEILNFLDKGYELEKEKRIYITLT